MGPFGNMPNPFMGNMPNQNIEQLIAQYRQLQQFLNGQQNFQMPNMNNGGNNPAMGQRGIWIQVNSYEEVAKYPVPTDGTPTLFFDYEHGIFYSKKFTNGQSCIQDFYFYLGNGGNTNNAENQSAAPEQPASSIDNAGETSTGAGDPVIAAIFELLSEIKDRLPAPAKAHLPPEVTEEARTASSVAEANKQRLGNK